MPNKINPSVWEFTLPASWASYLVNGDSSGLDPAELLAANRFLATENLNRSYFMDCGESFYSSRNDTGDGLAGEVCLFTYAPRRDEAPALAGEATHTRDSVMASVINAAPTKGQNPISGAKVFSIDDAFGLACEELAQKRNSHAALVSALADSIKSMEWALAAMPDIPEKSTFRENLATARALHFSLTA